MIELVNDKCPDTQALASLIIASAPELLSHLFGGEQRASYFLQKATQLNDGQFSHRRHTCAVSKSNVVGCVTMWESQMPDEFQKATINALVTLLQPDELAHVIQVNPALTELFPPPESHQLCFGHLSVDPEYQGQGVGSKLVAYLTRQARAKNKTELVLDVDSANEQALSFYEKWRFIVQSEKQYPATGQSFLRLSLDL